MDKTLKITEETHLMLSRFGRKDETFDQIIRRLLNERIEKIGDKQ